MHSALKLLILVGLIIWGFILLKEHMPNYLPDIRIADAETDERCQHFGRMEEGEQTLQYGDRIRQIFAGCW